MPESSASSAPSSSATLHFVHNAPPEDHDLKRQYLALLPPQQVIDICLTLDIHVPLALKRNIWPTDFRGTIATMQNVVPKVEETSATIPPMGSLPEDKKPQPPTESKPPDKQQPTAGPSKPPAPSLQPYAFSTQPAYPHAPYYQALPAGYAPYSYPAYPPPANGFPPGAYPAPAQPFPPAGYPQHPNPFFAATAVHHPESSIPNPAADDTDLPSYEDMIVEGLNAVGDPDGMAPKDLFNWMAARYPVQSNFRPSASQALQKAYRRGRFEKSTGGRYRLNPTWEGGNSSTRRATRRPQTQSAVPIGLQKPRAPASSPFTTVPRPVPLPLPVQAHAPPPPRPAPPPAEPPKPPPPAAVPAPAPTVPPNANDPYTAAQGILQSINFGALFKLEDGARVKSEVVTLSLAEHARAELQAQLALLAAQLEEIAQQEEDEADEDEDEDADMEEVV
ncbi:hypothetical protein B0H17DRAFT_1054209 [Mycena rosella]|uniref:Histone H1 n=1 Tax=Mycena rosella TaxID=1033263 RepID=A0AAD7GMC0_MYCRO|nr:hypothetical protein B0H17DRAFT_1054209 [Mycena rosella]